MDKTVIKALNLIEALARHGAPAGITQLAQELGLTKSNVFRLLKTLTREGYVSQDMVTEKYDLTLKLWHLGMTVHSRFDFTVTARPFIHHLVQETRESVHLSVFENGQVVYIDKVEGDQPVRAYSRVGDRPPCHSVATGKVLLAYLPDDVARVVFGNPLVRYTPRTIATAAALRKEIEAIRRDGYGINTGEWREGVCGVAAPVRDFSGKVVAAVGISGPEQRFQGNYAALSKPVIACAGHISHALGYNAGGASPSETEEPVPSPVARRRHAAPRVATKD